MIPRKTYSGNVATLTMTEFRRQPGEAIDFVRHGGTVYITKSGTHIASLLPANRPPCPTIEELEAILAPQAPTKSDNGRT